MTAASRNDSSFSHAIEIIELSSFECIFVPSSVRVPEEKSFIEAPFACAVAVDVSVLTVVPLVTPVKDEAVLPV